LTCGAQQSNLILITLGVGAYAGYFGIYGGCLWQQLTQAEPEHSKLNKRG